MPAKSKTKKTLLRRAVAATETAKAWPALVIGAVSEAAALAVGFGVLNSPEQGAIVALSTAAVNAAGWVAHSIHTGRISPASLQTYVGALVAQGVGLAVAFGFVNGSTASNVTALSVAVLAAVGQVMQAVKSTKVATVFSPALEVGVESVAIDDASIKRLAAAIRKPAKS